MYVLCALDKVIFDTSRQTYGDNNKGLSSGVCFSNIFYPGLAESMHEEGTPGHSSSVIAWKKGEGRGRRQSRGEGKKREEGMHSRSHPGQGWAQNSDLDQEAQVSLLPVPLLPLFGLLHLVTLPTSCSTGPHVVSLKPHQQA